jgi:hypothetical protein
MSIQTSCPGCGASCTLEPADLGRKTRCRECGQRFVVRDLRKPGAGDPAAVATPAPTAGGEQAVAVPLRRKKKRPKPAAAMSLRLWIVMGSVAAVLLLVGGSVALGMLILAWHRSPPSVVGRWKGSVQVRDDVSKVVNDQKAPPVVGNIIGGFAQLATDDLLAVTIDFKQNGMAFYSGNTAGLGITGEGDGTWEIVEAGRDVLVVRMGRPSAPFEARLAFRDRDTFSFSRLDQPDGPTVLFSRVRD